VPSHRIAPRVSRVNRVSVSIVRDKINVSLSILELIQWSDVVDKYKEYWKCRNKARAITRQTRVSLMRHHHPALLHHHPDWTGC